MERKRLEATTAAYTHLRGVLAIPGAVLVAGVLPIWHGPPDPGNVALVMCGAASILSGVLDHVAFTRVFAAPALDA